MGVAFGRIRSGSKMLDEPVEDVADRRLARFQPVHPRQDRAGDDPAQAGDVRERLIGGGDHHVAGAGADDLDERSGLHAGAHRAQVGVDRPNGHGHARRQPHPAGDCLDQFPAWRSAARAGVA